VIRDITYLLYVLHFPSVNPLISSAFNFVSHCSSIYNRYELFTGFLCL